MTFWEAAMGIRQSSKLILPIVAILSLISGVALAHEGFSLAPDPEQAPPVDPSRTTICSQDFEGSWPPAGWSVLHFGDSFTWSQTSAKQHTGTYSAWIQYCGQTEAQDEYLVSPLIDLSEISNLYLEFYEDEDYWSGYGDHHYIGISTTVPNDPDAYTWIADMTPANHTINGFDGDPVTFNLIDYAGEPVVFFCFRYTGTYADHWYIDDVRLYQPLPHDVAVTQITPDCEQYAAPETITPQVIVSNVGSNTETFDLRVNVFESEVLIYSEIEVVTLTVGQQDTLYFTEVELSDGQFYSLQGKALMVGDDDISNNSADAFVDTYTEQRIPFGYMHTNSGCGFCAPVDDLIDSYMASQGDAVSMIRVHTWWPYGMDLIFQDNISQAQELVHMWGYDYTPHCWVDGFIDLASAGSAFPGKLEERKGNRSPLLLDMHWNTVTETLLVKMNLLNPVDPEGDYRLKVSVTEDNILAPGGNGHNTHFDCFRYMYPDTDGLTVIPAVGDTTYTFHCPLDPLEVGWNQDELSFVAFFQDLSLWTVWQSRANTLADLIGHLSLDLPVTEAEQSTQFTIDLQVDPTFIGVASCEAQISFDNTLVRLDSITAGTWLTETGEGNYSFYDYTQDPPDPAESIHFLAELTDTSLVAVGQLAVCHFTALTPGAMELSYSLLEVVDQDDHEMGFLPSQLDSIIVTGELTAAPAEVAIINTLQVSASPNPFNPITMINYQVPETGSWRVEIFDIQGRRISTLFEGELSAGKQEIRWDGTTESGRIAGSGLYFARVSGVTGSCSTKLLLLK
jgi:hypothetical protein